MKIIALLLIAIVSFLVGSYYNQNCSIDRANELLNSNQKEFTSLDIRYVAIGE